MQIRGYDVGRLLGRGGFGRVFAGRARATGQAVAIKVFGRADDPRIAREVAALARVGPPHAPALVDEGTLADGTTYLVQERIDGPAVSQRCRDAGVVEIAGVLTRVAQAIDAAHAAGVAHRDLKPEHVRFRDDGAAVLLDFGLARVGAGGDDAIMPGLTRTGQRAGTAAYMAPEQASGASDVGGEADVYALGVLAFELLTGRLPFQGSASEMRRAHAFERPPRASSLAPLPSEVDEVLAGALAKQPAARPPSAGAFVERLRGALACSTASRDPETERAAPPDAAAAATRDVALLVAHVRARVERLDAVAGGATIARLEDDLVVFAFADAPVESGVAQAWMVAEQLRGKLGATTAVVHVARVSLRHRRRRRLISGPAIAQAEAWSGGAPPRTVMTADAARRVGAAATPLDETWWTLRSSEVGDASFVGRAALLAQLERTLATTALVTVVGEAGSGKTRVLHELARSRDGAGLRHLIAPDTRGAAPDLATPLVTWLLGCDVSELAVALGDAPLEPDERHGLARALGLATAGDTTGGAPGHVRDRAARAVAHLLRRAASERPIALLIDDAHRADAVALDALELATAEPVAHALAVCVTAAPALTARRPGWGARAVRAETHRLEPLDDDDAAALLRELLGTEFVPAAVVERLVASAAGLPLYVVEIAHALRSTGVVRTGSERAALAVASDEIARVSSTPLSQRLARQLLDSLPAELRRLAHACAVLGDEITPDDLRALQDAAAGDWLDPGVGLTRLLEAGVLRVAAPGLFRFRHPLLRAGVEQAIEETTRTALHRAALQALEGAPHPPLARLARHAQAAGDTERAAACWGALADDHRGAHRYVDAEQAYGAALACVPDGDPARVDLFTGRAEVRYRIQRFEDARDDATRARELARAAGDRHRTIAALLLEATIRDWLFDVDRSIELSDEAAALAAGAGETGFDAELALASGRAAYRRERLDDAIAELGRAAQLADDRQTVIAALLLLAPALLYAGRLDDSEARFEQVIELCRQAGDDAHLAAAYNNRQVLWLERHALERSVADLRRTLELARKLGNAQIERVATHNLAEILYWCGEIDEAHELAEHSRRLAVDLTGHELPDDALLVARIATAAGDALAAGRELQRLANDSDRLSPSKAILEEMVRLSRDGRADDGAWRDLFGRAAELPLVDHRLEICHAAARAALARGSAADAGAWCAEAAPLIGRSVTWKRRFDALR